MIHSFVKISFVLISLLVTSSQARSQILISLLFGDKLNSPRVEFGLDGGLSRSTLEGTPNAEAANTFNLGFYFDIKFKKNPNWMLHTGLMLKSNMGAQSLNVYDLADANLDSAFKGGEVWRKMHYFYLPVMIKYRFYTHFYAEAGFMAGLRTKAEDHFSKEEANGNALQYTNDISNQFVRLDAGLIGGIGYRLLGGNGMNLGIRYYAGLVDIQANASVPQAAVFNRAWLFNFGIPIGATKK